MGAGGAAEDATRTFALRAAHLVDATSEGLRDDAVVIVHDGKIVAVGGEAAIPEGAEIIDLGDATLMPGFIDVHSHLTLEPDEHYYRKTPNELLRNPTAFAFSAAATARRTLQAELGRASCRARVFHDVSIRVGAVALNKETASPPKTNQNQN